MIERPVLLAIQLSPGWFKQELHMECSPQVSKEENK